jgi:NTP pyrophosphatase (non-canonical NTP hydrolase)
MFYLYHIPNKKIGVTRDLNKRVTEQQGYSSDEYEVLDQSEDIDYISEREIELQKSYGYKVDRQKYNQLIKLNKKMEVNVTEQTTTFPVPLNKLKGNLLDNLGMSWQTDLGEFRLTIETVYWILANAKMSMYNSGRCYIYNKAYYEAFIREEAYESSSDSIFDLIRKWAYDRGIYDKGDSNTQYIKLMEEAGELAQGLLKRNDVEIYDAIGDMIVVLTNLAHMEGVKIEDCIQDAYDEIADRKGKMINGTFVKETL